MMAWETKELFTIYFSFWKSNSEDEGVIAVDAFGKLWQFIRCRDYNSLFVGHAY
jgi:hypothetical protein